MTLNEKLQEIELYFNYWTGNFQRKDLTTNNVRITAESVCKATILKIEGETKGTVIILGKTNLPINNRRSKKNEDLKFYELIQVLDELDIFQRYKDIKFHFELIRDKTNPSSHSSNHLSDDTTIDDLEVCNTSIKQILKWFYQEKLSSALPKSVENAIEGHIDISLISSSNEKWQELLIACKDFEKKNQYILVSPPSISDNIHAIESLVKIPWRLVLDFNPKTDEEETGLLYNFQRIKGSSYKKSFTINDRPDFDPKFEHYWFLANGQGVIHPLKDFISWRSKYKRFLSEPLYQSFVKGSRLKTRIVILLNIAPNYAEAIIDEFNAVDETNLSFVICSAGDYNYDIIFERFSNVELIDISIEQIAKGINNSVSFAQLQKSATDVYIPHKKDQISKSFIKIKQEDYDYLFTLGIEIIYKDIEKKLPTNEEPDSFYKGSIVTWQDIYNGKVIDRNKLEDLEKRLKFELDRNKLQELELVHDAGAGGTTVARTLAFRLHDDYPTIVLKKYETKKTIAGLRIIYDQYTKGSLPLLIILESFEVKESGVLHRDLAQAIKNAVILIVRRGLVSTAKDKKFILKAQLDLNEISLFENRFSAQVPSRKDKIDLIKKEYRANPRYISPFVYALVAYDKNFNGVESYVVKCIEDTTIEQKKIVGFICLIYHFTQHVVSPELFATVLNTNRNSCDLRKIIGNENPIFELLHEEYDIDDDSSFWRPRHEILGEEAIKILLSGNKNQKENWKTYLAQWLIELIVTIKSAVPFLDDETKQILDSLFIYRTEYEGLVATKDAFTEVFNNLKNTDGQAIFEELTNSYPNDPHYHGHFARYLYNDKIGIKNYNRAIEEAEKSLEILPNDSRLIHTLGMCYREKAEELIANFETSAYPVDEIENQVQDLIEQACDYFDKCIEIDPNNIYAHDSEIRVLLKGLDFGFKIHGSVSKELFISNPKNEWYSRNLDKISNLLEDALYVIEQAKGLENLERINKSAGYLHECEANFFKVLGRSFEAKNKFQNLIKNTPSGYQFMVPHYRRMYINCLLASKSKNQKDLFNAWEYISESELEEAVKYLSDNILEDATNTYNIRLWLQAIRFLKNPPSLDDCITKIGMWTQTIGQNLNSILEGYYYLYVLNAIKSISSGETFDPTSVHNVKELKAKMNSFVKNEKFCFEWFGHGIGIQKMVNHKKLGEFTSDFFEKNAKYLSEVQGRIKEVSSSQQGIIILDCGLEAFFVPSHGGFTERNLNDKVSFYVGFRYDQIQAWSVLLVNKKRDETIQKQEFIEIKEFINDDIEDENETEIVVEKIEPYNIEIKKIVGPKLIGKIDIEQIEQKTSKKGDIKYDPLKIYNGVVKILKNDFGYISSKELDKDIYFHKSHLKNYDFYSLTEGVPAKFSISIKDKKPLTDLAGRNYQAIEVSISAIGTSGRKG